MVDIRLHSAVVRTALARLLLAFSAALGLSAVAAGQAAAKTDGAAKAREITGAQVSIELRSGTLLKDVNVVETRPGRFRGTVAAITVTEAEAGKRTVLGAAAVKRVTLSDGTPCLVYDAAARTLIPPDADNLDEIRRGQPEEPRPAAERRPESPRPSKEADAERRKQEELQARTQREAERIAFYKKTGVWRWPELTPERQRAALDEEKQYLKEVGDAFRALGMRLTETEYFLFFSDMPPQQAAIYTPYLDKMYQELCAAFGIAKGTNIWRGKGVVIAFVQEEAFQEFERRFFKEMDDDIKAQGLAHQRGDGTVIISCFRGDSPAYFANLLVHETSHGFMHRYKSSQHMPSWLSEGSADWIAGVVVSASKSVLNRQREAILQMRQTRSLGGDFFTGQRIHEWQYGAASSMTDFLLRTDRKRYRELIEGIKMGTPWEESLKKSYGLTPEQLADRYGLYIGMSDLKP